MGVFYSNPLETNPIISDQQRHTIFSNCETIARLNKKFLIDIENRLREWDSNDCLGDIFKEITPFFKMYTTYINNHEAATQELESLKKDSKWMNFLSEAMKKAPVLENLLITPIQRIPRYKLLIQ